MLLSITPQLHVAFLYTKIIYAHLTVSDLLLIAE